MPRTSLLLFSAAAISLGQAIAQSGGPTADELGQVDALFSAELAKQNYASVTGGIVYGGQLVWSKSYGLADIGNNIAASVDTVYNMGSVGKQFTAVMLLQLVDRGVVHLSDPVEMYVPEVKQIQDPFANAPPMTLIQLATHTSGLTPEGDEPQTPPGQRSQWEQLLLSVLPQIKFYFQPGTHYQYSNAGYAILGLALERAAGQHYLDYLPSQIFSPLGMTHTGYALTPDMAAHAAKGYALMNGAPTLAGDPTKSDLGRAYLTPAGGEYTTVGDMAKFVALELGQGPDSVLSLNSIRTNLSQVSSANGDLSFGYGVGFGASRMGTSVILGHDGGVTFGFYAAAYFKQSAGVGMILLRNADPTQGKSFGPKFYFSVLDTATPPCPTPSVVAVTNASYDADIGAGDTVIAWGSGFTPFGGNVLQFSNGGGDLVQFGEQDGIYFWDQSGNQINAALGNRAAAGNWQLTVTNACGAQSAPLALTIR